MQILAAILGCCMLALVLVDAFNTLVLAHRTQNSFRIARACYKLTWKAFAAVGRRIESGRARETFLSIFGPLSLLALVTLWVAGLAVAFGLIQWAIGMEPSAIRGTFFNDLYLSAGALFTLTTGDPKNSASKMIAVAEGGLGLGFLGLVIGYLPVLYQSFSKRELAISLLDARAGSPPSAGRLLAFVPPGSAKLESELAHWEKWSAQVLENQLSFPMLSYFRSQHSNQSWISALVAVVDCAAIVSLAARDDLQCQADLTFAIGRHTLADIAAIFGTEKKSDHSVAKLDRLSDVDFLKLRQILAANPKLFDAERCSASKLQNLRALYEPQASVLSTYFLMALPRWIADEASRDNWKVGRQDRDGDLFAVSDPFTEQSQAEEAPEDAHK